MAHFKVVVGALLACAICVHGFPADSPASSGFGIGSSSFEQNKPSGSFGGPSGSTYAPRPLPGSFYPQQVSTGSPSFGSTTVNRFVRDDSHEQAHGHTANSDSASSTSAPHRRDATTETIKSKPLTGAFAAATTEHTAARRDESSVLGGATVKPVSLPGSLAASSSVAATTAAAPKNKRDQNSQANGSTSRKPFQAATVPATFNKPTAAPLNKRDQGSQVYGSTSRPVSSFGSGSTSRPSVGSGFQNGKPLSATEIASKIKRDADEARAAGTTSKPAAASSTSSGAKPAVKPLVSSTTASSKNKRESTSTSSPVKPVRPLWPSTTAEPSSTYRVSTSSSRNKRQAPVSASDEASDDNDNDNRQLFNRPTLIPRPNGNERPTRRPLPGAGLFNRRTTTPSSIASNSNAASFTAVTQARPSFASSTTVSGSKFKRDQFPGTHSTDTYQPLNVEHFSGSETLPGQTTYFTGSSVSSNPNPGNSGFSAGTSGFSGTSVSGTSFSNNPHLTKRETDDGDSSSGEESQED